MARKDPSKKNILLNLPVELHRAFKKACADNDTMMSREIVKFVESYASDAGYYDVDEEDSIAEEMFGGE